MLYQETFFPWIILSLGIHIAALSFCPPPVSWSVSGQKQISIDLLYGSGGDGMEQPGDSADSGTPANKKNAPPAAPKQSPRPVVRPKTESPAMPRPSTVPLKKTIPEPVPAENPIQKETPVPAAVLNTSRKNTDLQEQVPATSNSVNTSTLGASDGTVIAGQESSQGAGGGNGQGTGQGLPGSGSGHGGTGGGSIRATPLGYGENPPMPYPRTARRRGWEGEVLLRVQVSSTGTVIDIRIEKSCGYSILDNTARKEVRAWRFRPASRGGIPKADTVLVPVQFQLHAPR